MKKKLKLYTIISAKSKKSIEYVRAKCLKEAQKLINERLNLRKLSRKKKKSSKKAKTRRKTKSVRRRTPKKVNK